MVEASAANPRLRSKQTAPNHAPAKLDGEPMVDVWSRSGSKYRIRAVVLLAINVVLFAGVSCFAYWIRSGVALAPMMPGYWGEIAETFNFSGQPSITLAHMLVEPISVQDVPMQIFIIGLLMAALIAIPILVSILYRFWSSVPFILSVCILAVMPWLAITLLGACVIASLRPFRTRIRFVSALFALVPIVAYLMMAWHGSEEMVMGRFDPIDRVKFVAPWVLAVVASTLVFAIVLGISKIVDHRPGAITALLAVMFGLPVGLFEFHVGRDELHYRVLESLNNYYFMAFDAKLDLTDRVERRWASHPLPRPSWDELFQAEQQRWQSELDADPMAEESALVRHKAELIHRCDRFLGSYPSSRYAMNVLYIKARAIDMRVDSVEFRDKKWIRFYDGFPHETASRETWGIIAGNAHDTSVWAASILALSRLDARQCDVDRALDKLDALIEWLESSSDPIGREARSSADRGLLDRDSPEAGLKINLDQILVHAHRLRDLLRKNEDPLYGYDPLCRTDDRNGQLTFGFLHLHPRHEMYRKNLMILRHRFPHARIEDNIDLEIAKATPWRAPATEAEPLGEDARSSISLLESLIEQFPKGDAIPEALYELGVASFQRGGGHRSGEAFARLTAEFPDSIWSRLATRYSVTEMKPIGVAATHGR